MKILVVSFILIFISITAMFFQAQHAVDAYLWSWIFWLQMPLGALTISLLHDLTGGRWGDIAKSNLRSMMKSFWIAPLLFLPLLFKLNFFYPWLQSEIKNKTLLFKTPFFQWPVFSLRASLYFLIILYLIKVATKSQNRTHISAIALLVYVLIMSLISVDWFMAREPEWYSTIYGLIWILSQTITAWAFVLALKLFNKKSHNDINADQGSIFLVLLISWGYLSFMQYLIIWSGNLPHEVSWYLVRLSSSWQLVIIAVALGSLIFPFFVLINKNFKLDSHLLARLAIVVLIFRILDTIWIILPVDRKALQITIWDLVSFLGIGSLWITFFIRSQRSLTKEERI